MITPPVQRRGAQPSPILSTFANSSASCLCGLRPILAHGTHKDYDKIDALRGLNISITTTAKTDDECKALLTAFRFPFKN